MRALLVGGGGAAYYDWWASGGGGGYVSCGMFDVRNSTNVLIVVGSGAIATTATTSINFLYFSITFHTRIASTRVSLETLENLR